ncbi:hypothetical protein ACYOEI_38105, partial [Singulisphaera rosea]
SSVGGTVSGTSPTGASFEATGLDQPSGFFAKPASLLAFTSGVNRGKTAKVTSHTNVNGVVRFGFALGFPKNPEPDDTFILIGYSN